MTCDHHTGNVDKFLLKKNKKLIFMLKFKQIRLPFPFISVFEEKCHNLIFRL